MDALEKVPPCVWNQAFWKAIKSFLKIKKYSDSSPTPEVCTKEKKVLLHKRIKVQKKKQKEVIVSNFYEKESKGNTSNWINKVEESTT